MNDVDTAIQAIEGSTTAELEEFLFDGLQELRNSIYRGGRPEHIDRTRVEVDILLMELGMRKIKQYHPGGLP